jgi:hypothetical protein
MQVKVLHRLDGRSQPAAPRNVLCQQHVVREQAAKLDVLQMGTHAVHRRGTG